MQKKFGIAVVMALLAAPVASRRGSTLSLSRLCDLEGRSSPDYRYAIVNQHTVVVDPTTRRIVQIVKISAAGVPVPQERPVTFVTLGKLNEGYYATYVFDKCRGNGFGRAVLPSRGAR